MSALAIIASSLDKFATELRHLQRTEVLEAEEAAELKRRLFTAEILGFVIGPLVGLIG
jgi:hypothetical protein